MSNFFKKYLSVLGLILGVMSLSTLIGTERSFAADLQKIRIKSDPLKTEIILDLKGSVSAYSVNQDNPQIVAIKFDGQIDPALKNRSQVFSGNSNLTSIYWESKGDKIQFFVKRKAPSGINVYPLENPNRLVIRIDENFEHTRTHPIAPGIIHRQITRSTAKGSLNINILEVDPQNSNLEITPVLASSVIHGKARVKNMVNNNQAIAGINAAFFKPDSGTNIGTVILGKELVAGPMYNRVSLGITSDKQFKIARISLKGDITLSNGLTIPIHTVNQPRTQKGQFILYTSRWGNTAPPTPKGGIQLQIKDDRITAVSSERLSIPSGGYVLVCDKSVTVENLQQDNTVSVKAYTVPDWSDVEYAISGGPYLVKSGQVFVDIKEQFFRESGFTKKAPRTAVGVTKNNHLLMVTVDGRQEESVGMTLHEMAYLMKKLGAVEAMNFDGGSSTQMVIGNVIVNSPSVSGGAKVSSAIIVRYDPLGMQKEIIGAKSDDSTEPNF